jgi:hypothetical protein
VAQLASIVDGDALLKVVWVSLATGVGVTLAFGLAILGTVRSVDSSRSGHPAQGIVFGILGFAALAAVAVAIVLGIVAMAHK